MSVGIRTQFTTMSNNDAPVISIPAPMKLALLFAVLLLSTLHVRAGDALTKEAWINVINQDAKESTLEARLGLPSFKKSTGGVTRYYWIGKLDTGSTTPEALGVVVLKYNGVLLVVAIWDPVTEEASFFPWYDKVLKAQ